MATARAASRRIAIEEVVEALPIAPLKEAPPSSLHEANIIGSVHWPSSSEGGAGVPPLLEFDPLPPLHKL